MATVKSQYWLWRFIFGCSGDFCHLFCRQWRYKHPVSATLTAHPFSRDRWGTLNCAVSERMKTLVFDRAGHLCALHSSWFHLSCPTFSQPFLKPPCSSLWGADIPVQHERPLKSDRESCRGLLWFSPHLGEVGKAFFYWFLRPFRSRGHWALHRNRLSLKVS